jgi:hypothetical protein
MYTTYIKSIGGQCYDCYLQQFSQILAKYIGVFLEKNKVMILLSAYMYVYVYVAVIFSQNVFGEKNDNFHS